jgi:hypothetical protein
MRITALLLPALLVAAIGPAVAQETKPTGTSVFKVEYRIRDASDPAAKAGRRYTMLLDTTGRGSFHVGDRVPVASGQNQFSYVDVGVNIDTTLREPSNESRLMLVSSLDMSTIVEHKQPAGSSVPANPTIAQTRIQVNALVPMGKPTVVASIDDPATQHRLDVEVLITKE